MKEYRVWLKRYCLIILLGVTAFYGYKAVFERFVNKTDIDVSDKREMQDYLRGSWKCDDSSEIVIFSGDAELSYFVRYQEDRPLELTADKYYYQINDKGRAVLSFRRESYEFRELNESSFTLCVENGTKKTYTRLETESKKIEGTFFYHDKKFLFNSDSVVELKENDEKDDVYKLNYLGENVIFIDGQIISGVPFYRFTVEGDELLLFPLYFKISWMKSEEDSTLKSDPLIRLKCLD